VENLQFCCFFENRFKRESLLVLDYYPWMCYLEICLIIGDGLFGHTYPYSHTMVCAWKRHSNSWNDPSTIWLCPPTYVAYIQLWMPRPSLLVCNHETFQLFPIWTNKKHIYIYVGMCMHLSRNMWFCTLNKCVHVHRTMHVSYMYSICMFRELHGYTSIDLRIYTYIYILGSCSNTFSLRLKLPRLYSLSSIIILLKFSNYTP
jgi:hypothetical protein